MQEGENDFESGASVDREGGRDRNSDAGSSAIGRDGASLGKSLGDGVLKRRDGDGDGTGGVERLDPFRQPETGLEDRENDLKRREQRLEDRELDLRMKEMNLTMKTDILNLVNVCKIRNEPLSLDEAFFDCHFGRRLHDLGIREGEHGALRIEFLLFSAMTLAEIAKVRTRLEKQSDALAEERRGLVEEKKSLALVGPLSRFTLQSFLDQRVERMADKLCTDFLRLNDLRLQRDKWCLGQNLLQPLPVTCCETNSSADKPSFVDMLLPYVGSVDAYWKAICSEAGVAEQSSKRVVAVAQASGSGKTRLSYAVGQKKALVIVIRIAMQKSEALAEPWQKWHDVVKQLPLRIGSSGSPEQVASFGMTCLRLLVVSYVEWVAKVLHAISTRGCSSETFREAALRSLRNGSGDAGVLALFSDRMSQFFPDGYTTTKIRDMDAAREAVKKHAADVNKFLRGVVGPEEAVVISYDEVQFLFDVLRDVFYPLNEWNGSQISGAPTRSAFHALIASMPSFLDGVGWYQTMCGTYFKISAEAVSKLSPIAHRVQALYHASVITVDDMRRSLEAFFLFKPGFFERAEIQSCLSFLRGRPKFFFGHAWTIHIWKELSARTSDAESIDQLVLRALQRAVEDLKQERTNDLRILWVSQPEPIASNLDVTTALFCRELYASLKFCGGRLSTSGIDADVVRHGIFAFSPSADMELDLRSEPATVHALLSVGDSLVLRSGQLDPHFAGVRTKLDEDPILPLLKRYATMGAIAGFHFTTNVKGSVWEVAFVWHILRCRIIMQKANVTLTLSTLFSPLCASKYTLPEGFNQWDVLADEGWDASMLQMTDEKPTHFHHLLDGPEACRRVMYNVERDAGADVLFLVQQGDGSQARTLVSVQCKAEKSSSLRECLRSSSPAWQFTTDPQRAVVLKGKKIPSSHVPKGGAKEKREMAWSSKREAFCLLWSSNASVFENAVRVALSVNDYSDGTAEKIAKLNRTDKAIHRSPIVLCRSSAASFGALHDAMSHACAGDKTSGTEERAFLLPQSADKVTRSKVDK